MKHKEKSTITYTPDKMKPVIRSSICTGERVAGFKDKTTGKFTEIMLIENERDIESFMKTYGIPVAELSREW